MDSLNSNWYLFVIIDKLKCANELIDLQITII